jgi:hypothetical protein
MTSFGVVFRLVSAWSREYDDENLDDKKNEDLDIAVFWQTGIRLYLRVKKIAL